MTTVEMAKVEQEVKQSVEKEMTGFCETNGITAGWSVAQHAKFQLGLVMDVVETGDAIDAEEAKFRLYVILRTLANYSAWRQAHERDGTAKTAHLPLAAGTGRGMKSLAGEYAGL